MRIMRLLACAIAVGLLVGSPAEARRADTAAGAAPTSVRALGAVPAGAARAADNSTTYTDATSDNQGRLAPDITTVVVANENDGDVFFQLTLLDEPRLLAGDVAIVFIDADHNPATGSPTQAGVEVALLAEGTGGPTTFSFCQWNGAWGCQATQFGEDEILTASSHRITMGVNFTDVAQSFAINFWTVSVYTDPATRAEYRDWAPDQGTYEYQALITTDTDGDGLLPPQDRCPTTPGGDYDYNNNGCPGPFKRINPSVDPNGYAVAGAYYFSSIVFRPVPNGARVVMASGSQRQTFRARGAAARSRPWRGAFSIGSAFSVRITQPGWVGFSATLRVAGPGRMAITNRRCIPAVGPQVARPCSPAMNGR
jgi:hypothetical protein